ncbi:MAG: GNAT family N-acetyltransferase [Pseudomonadota bacterium]
MKLTQRKANIHDLPAIIWLLQQDEFGKTREQASENIDQRYLEAFDKINNDPNQYLMVVEMDNQIIGTCHLTILPSLTFTGATRMQIEAVRVRAQYRGQNIGAWMINEAIDYGKANGATIIQLTSNKQRQEAIKFYKKLGFKATHQGMKLYLQNQS